MKSIILMCSLALTGFVGVSSGAAKTGKSKVWEALEKGEEQTIVFLGTSQFQETWSSIAPSTEAELERLFPGLATVEYNDDICHGGRVSKWGIGRVEDVMAFEPNAVFIEFCFMDAFYGNDCPIETCSRPNWIEIIDKFREADPEVEIFLYKTHRPYDKNENCWEGKLACEECYFDSYYDNGNVNHRASYWSNRQCRPSSNDSLAWYFDMLDELADIYGTYVVDTYTHSLKVFEREGYRTDDSEGYYKKYVYDSSHPTQLAVDEFIVPIVLNVLQGNGSVVGKALACTPSKLEFSGVVGSPSPSAKTVAVTSSSGQAPTISISEKASWLTVSVSGPQASKAILENEITLEGLEDGEYSTIVTITEEQGSIKEYEVTLTVSSAAELLANPDTLVIASPPGVSSPSAAEVSIHSSDGSLSEIGVASDAEWLSWDDPTPTGDSVILIVRADPTGLEDGEYRSSLVATSPGKEDFSLPVVFKVGLKPLNITAPVSGDTLQIGDSVSITWEFEPSVVTKKVYIEVSFDAGITFYEITENTLPPSQKRFEWKIPESLKGVSPSGKQLWISLREYSTDNVDMAGPLLVRPSLSARTPTPCAPRIGKPLGTHRIMGLRSFRSIEAVTDPVFYKLYDLHGKLLARGQMGKKQRIPVRSAASSAASQLYILRLYELQR